MLAELILWRYYNKHCSSGSLAQCNFGWFQSTNKLDVIMMDLSVQGAVLPYPEGVTTVSIQASKRKEELKKVNVTLNMSHILLVFFWLIVKKLGDYKERHLNRKSFHRHARKHTFHAHRNDRPNDTLVGGASVSPMLVNSLRFKGQMLPMPDIPFVDSSTHSSSALMIYEYTPLLPDVLIKADSRCLHIKLRELHYEATKECEELRQTQAYKFKYSLYKSISCVVETVGCALLSCGGDRTKSYKHTISCCHFHELLLSPWCCCHNTVDKFLRKDN